MASTLDFCQTLESEQRISCQVYYYWTEAASGKEMPALADLERIDLPNVHENLFLIAKGNGSGFVVESSGGVLTEVCGGEEPRGFPLSEVLPAPLNERAVDICTTAVAARQPQYDFATIEMPNGDDMKYRLIVLPLMDRENQIAHLLGAVSFRVMEDGEE